MINNVVLVGRAGGDPDVKTFNSGEKVANINMALNRKQKGEKHTDWFRIECWGKAAEIAEKYVRKGHIFGVEGQLRTWEKDGKKGVTVRADSVRLFDNKDDAEGQAEEQQPTGNAFDEKQASTTPW